MYHQWQARLYRPPDLLLEGQQLLLFELAAPVEVEPHLADGDDAWGGAGDGAEIGPCGMRGGGCGARDGSEIGPWGGGQVFADGAELVGPVGAHLLGVQSQHGVAHVGVLSAGVHDAATGLQVDGRQEHPAAPGLPGPLDDVGPVGVELLAVQVAVGINIFRHC